MIELDPNLIKQMVAKGKRIDHRKFDEYRKITIEPGVIQSAEGSCRVTIGDTVVIAGVKMDMGTPYPDTPDEGAMSVAVELLPLASPEFEAGPPAEQAIELARVVDRAIRESKCIDFSKLNTEPGKKVWMVFVDIDVIDDDGNRLRTLIPISRGFGEQTPKGTLLASDECIARLDELTFEALLARCGPLTGGERMKRTDTKETLVAFLLTARAARIRNASGNSTPSISFTNSNMSPPLPHPKQCQICRSGVTKNEGVFSL